MSSFKLPTPQELQAYLSAGLPCDHLSVTGDGQHFEATIVSPVFEGKTTLARHRMVYAVLGERMRAEIHALSMRTLTPAQWAESAAAAPR